MKKYMVRWYFRGMARTNIVEARSVGDAKAAINYKYGSRCSINTVEEVI